MYQPAGGNSGNDDQITHEIAVFLAAEIRKGNISLIVGGDMVYAEEFYRELSGFGIKFPEEGALISVNSLCGKEYGMGHPVTSIAHDRVLM